MNFPLVHAFTGEPLIRREPLVPTMVDLTPEMIDRAAIALMAEDSEEHLRDCYGKVSRKRARRFAQAALEAALDLRRED